MFENAGHRPFFFFFIFSRERGAKSWLSPTNFQELKNRATAGEGVWESPHGSSINAETRGSLADVLIHFFSFTSIHPSKPLSEFCSDFESRTLSLYGPLPPVGVQGGHFVFPLLSRAGPISRVRPSV